MHLFIFLAIGSMALFSFLAVATWSGERRREREAYYRAETAKRIAESQGTGNSAIEFLREEERIAAHRHTEGMKLGGLITLAVGIGICIALKGITQGNGDSNPNFAYAVGAIPGLIGLAMLVYAYVLGPEGIINRK